MRIAVISDVHGNLPALDAVVVAIEAERVDLTVNCGDLLSGYVQPAETADRLIGLGLPTVAGNHERQVLTFGPDRIGMADRVTRELLTERHLEWLRSLPATVSPVPGVLAFHGSPTDDLQYLMHTVDAAGAREASLDEVVRRLGDAVVGGFSLLLCGHTHLPGALRLPGGALLVNPGSVGWPAYDDDEPFPHRMEAGSPHARFAVVDDVSGVWEVSFRQVEYPWERAAGFAEGFGRADVAAALRTGRVA
ncbi:metallophosphoesterase family protein [Actinoplanes derwentensis]|uniref:Predicted phosphodiesterase n=1 Tax=Actinoplanes derwentensis TaxID=113562 RepID=A0A1H1WH82_9ACTN|nr:metallophosphoesterase family protein [Actinoplanes derwentensis]GID87409.1 DNA methylase [Actinoplanes derwentensis]SDS95636.1 Predicted phosphodiesterase [Actinoplanes derwentensis]